MKNPAPILLFIYNRPEHTRQTLDHLFKNRLCEISQLFIFSDGAKNQPDAEKVNQVRKFINSIKGFKNIEIKEREKNLGLANSVISGVNEVFELYDRVIVLEDDIITSQSFLTFMNEALDFYQDDSKIFSVSGYAYPINLPRAYQSDVYISYRASSWGWATWKDRWKKTDWNVKDYEEFKVSKSAQNNFNRAGKDLTQMLHNQMKVEIDSWAIRWAYSHYKNNAYCLYPVESFCRNIGTDKSGTHSAATKKFDVKLNDSEEKFNFTHELKIDDGITNSIQKLFKPSPVRELINLIKNKL